MVLNLDSDFKPLDGLEIQYEKFTFSGGEPHIKILSTFNPNQKVIIAHRIKSFNDLGLLLVAVDALRRLQIKNIELVLPYFPGARQDRLMISGEPLTVKIYASLINELRFDKLMIFDPHSEVTTALLENCEVISNHKFIKEVLKIINEEVVIISPDSGALKKIFKLSEVLGGIEVIECSKIRDVKTGNLNGFKVFSDDINGKNCLIVDDICDGGGTFIGLAEELKKKNAGKIYLAVSHGIFSKGIEVFENLFEHIFTTNSFNDVENKKLKQIKLNHGLLS